MLREQVGSKWLVERVQRIGIVVGRKGTQERTSLGTWKVTNMPTGISVGGTHPSHSSSTTKCHEVRWAGHSLNLRGIPRSGLKATNELKGGKMTWGTFNLFR